MPQHLNLSCVLPEELEGTSLCGELADSSLDLCCNVFVNFTQVAEKNEHSKASLDANGGI